MAVASLESRVFLTGDTDGALRALYMLGAECSKQALVRVIQALKEDIRGAEDRRTRVELNQSLMLLYQVAKLRGVQGDDFRSRAI